MAVCSFFGHRDIYDTNLLEKLQDTVGQIVRENETVEFLIYPNGNFYALALFAALQAKHKYGKKVTFTLVCRDRIPLDGTRIDRIEILSGYSAKEILRWIVRKSTHMISYWYEEFPQDESKIYKLAKGITKLHMYDITSRGTQAKILKILEQLNLKRQREVWQKLSSGCTIKEIAEQLNISTHTVRQDEQRFQCKVRDVVQRNLTKMLMLDEMRKIESAMPFLMGQEDTYAYNYGMSELAEDNSKKAICSFFGCYRIYDADLEEKLQNTIQDIIQENDVVEFLISPCTDFFRLCLLVALQEKYHCEKVVKIICVLTDMQDCKEASICMADHTIKLSTQLSCNREQWLIQSSTHLISYWYEGFYGYPRRNPMFEPEFHLSGLQIFDITDEMTKAAIAEIRKRQRMTELQRLIFQKKENGDTLQQIAESLGRSVSRIQRSQGVIYSKVRKAAGEMLRQPLRERSCSIFSMGNMTYPMLISFQNLICSLVRDFGVTTFYVLPDDCQKEYMGMLADLPKKYPIFRLIILATIGEQEEIEQARKNFCPPCHEVERLDHTNRLNLSGITMRKADFFMCNSESYVADSIRECLTQSGSILVNLQNIRNRR